MSSYDSDSDEEETAKKEGDIQDKPDVQGHVSTCATFAGQQIKEAYEGEKVAVELRVVRVLEKGKKQIYTIGTIVEICGKEKVKVQWDNSENNTDEELNMKDLRLYDNAQIGVKHHYFACDGCDESPLQGIRWKCLSCSDYDLCTACYMADKHYLNHSFVRIQSKKSKGFEVPPRGSTEWFECSGILKSSRVSLRGKPGHSDVGTVIQLSDKKVHAFMCDAIVEMDETQAIKRFCVGSSKPGMRVVRGPAYDKKDKSDKFNADGGSGGVGTVIKVSKAADSKQAKKQRPVSGIQGQKALETDSGTTITVQWDNGETTHHKTINGKCRDLRLFDNRQIGIEHNAYCDECPRKPKDKVVLLKGMRWKCADCPDYDLCTDCYMSDKHMDEEEGYKCHKFIRIIEPNSKRKKIEKPRGGSKTNSFGIFKDAAVAKFGDGILESKVKKGLVHEAASGKVKEIRDCRINTGRSEVVVLWKSKTTEKRPFIDLKLQGNNDRLYPDHLPILGNDPRGYISLNYGHDSSQKKIEVNLWYRTELEDKPSSSPILYLIFANHQNHGEETDMTLLEEIIDFSKKSTSYCHLIGPKILLHHMPDGNDEVFIHKSTGKDLIQKLMKKGYSTFHRADTDDKEGDIDYFLRMAKTCSGAKMLPIIISLRNGRLRKDILKNVGKSKTPILCFKKQSLEVFILTTRKELSHSVKMTKYGSNLRVPGSIVSEKCEVYDIGMFNKGDDNEEIAYISDIHYESENLEAHICHLLLGVAINAKAKKKTDIFGMDTCTYIEALSVHLLKEGKWKLPKDTTKVPFSQRSIELIYEEDMTSDFEKGLWKDLQNRSGLTYRYPKWRKKTSAPEYCPHDEDSSSEISDESDEDINETDDETKPSKASTQSDQEEEIKPSRAPKHEKRSDQVFNPDRSAHKVFLVPKLYEFNVNIQAIKAKVTISSS